VTVFANYWKRNAVFQGDRKFSTFALSDGNIVAGSTDPEFFNGTPLAASAGGVPGLFAAGSAGIPGGGLLVLEGGLSQAISDLCPTTNFLCRFDVNGDVLAFNSPQDRFNYAPDNFLQLNGQRWTFTANANFEINQYLNFYTELNFVNNLVDNELAPTPVFSTLSLDVDSPFFSADTQAKFAALDNGLGTSGTTGVFPAGDGFLVAFITRRNVEVGRRQSINDRNAYRVVVGFDGTLDNGWRYDAYYSFGRVGRLERQENNIFVARLINALATIPDGSGGIQCSGTDSGCIPVNIFGEGNVTPAMAASIAIPVSNYTRNVEQIGSISLTGDLFDLGSGPVGFAVGFEYRREFADFRPDFALSSGQAFGFNQAQPLKGKFELWELYVETIIPLLSDMPAVEMLEVSLAARFSDYTTAGTVYTYAAGVNWDVVDGFRVRAGYQRAVRAPNVSELFSGQGQNFPGAQDPCAKTNFQSLVSANPNLAAACVNNGVGAASVGVFVQTNSQIPALTGGNPDLGEETADTYTVGFVAQPNFIPGLNITLDYYNIEITDVITQFGGSVQNVVNTCLLTQGGDPNSQFCQAITRRGSGAIQVVTLQNANAAVLSTEGFDLQIDYNLELSEFGRGDGSGSLSVFFLGTHVIDSTFISDAVSAPLQCAGNFGANCGQPDPHWRSSTRVTWSKGPVAISSRWRYIGATNDDDIENIGADPTTLARPTIDAKHYFDLSFTYQYNEHFTIFGGIDNVFSNLPPILGTNQEQANTFPRTFPTLGSRFFIGGTARF
jgi:outer membrane receptor protein involved in Fe transport